MTGTTILARSGLALGMYRVCALAGVGRMAQPAVRACAHGGLAGLDQDMADEVLAQERGS